MTDSCARCGKTQDQLPVVVIQPPPEVLAADPDAQPEELRRFAIYDVERDIHICNDCREVFMDLLPRASEYLLNMGNPGVQANILADITDDEKQFFGKLLFGHSLNPSP